MELKLLKQKALLLLLLIFTFTLFFACQKQDRELKEVKNENLPEQGSDTKGLTDLLGILDLNKHIKSSLITTSYHYFSKIETGQLWIISLKPGTYGFAKAKIAANLKDGWFSMIIASYNYDTALYKKGDFSTYTGTTSVYDQQLKKLRDFVYEKGKLKQIKIPDCPTCALCGNCPTPDGDWCVVYPPLCDYSGGEGTGSDEQPAKLMRNPDYGSGGGGSGVPDSYYDPVYIDGEWYTQTDFPGKTYGFPWKWWENDVWLSNPNSFSLDLDPEQNNQYDELTVAEKILVKAHPRVAATIWFNKSIAESQTVSKMGVNGLNDESDAFRHCYFQAINTMSVGASLTQQFSDAHESEVPAQLVKEKQMDLFNNNVGINYGQSLSFWISISTLAEGVYNKVTDGELRYLRPINLSDPDFWGTGGVGNPNTATHGISSSTILIPTNQ